MYVHIFLVPRCLHVRGEQLPYHQGQGRHSCYDLTAMELNYCHTAVLLDILVSMALSLLVCLQENEGLVREGIFGVRMGVPYIVRVFTQFLHVTTHASGGKPIMTLNYDCAISKFGAILFAVSALESWRPEFWRELS